MQITKQDEFYQVVLITGPNHNLLRVAFANHIVESLPSIETLPTQGECVHGELSKSKILQAVVSGIDDANAEFGTNYFAQRIQFVVNDTPPETKYRALARKLVEHLAIQNSSKQTTDVNATTQPPDYSTTRL